MRRAAVPALLVLLTALSLATRTQQLNAGFWIDEGISVGIAHHHWSSIPGLLGKDGSLWNIQRSSQAAGHVYAKTGTFQVHDLLHDGVMVTGKGLAGYITTADGQRLAFAIYVNNVEVKDAASVTPVVGDALGAIAAAAFDAKIDRKKRSE